MRLRHSRMQTHKSKEHSADSPDAQTGSGSRIQWVLHLLEKLVLDLQTLHISLDRAYGVHNCVLPHFHFEFAQLARGYRPISGIVIGEARIPPDSSVEVRRKLHPRLVGSRLTLGTI